MIDATVIAIIGTVVATVYGLVRLLEYVIQNFVIRKSDKQDCPFSSSKENQMNLLYKEVSELHKILELKDVHGVPMCYFPRSNQEMYAQIIEMLSKISDRLVEMAVSVYNVNLEQQRHYNDLQSIKRKIERLL